MKPLNILVLHNVEDVRRTRMSIIEYILCFERYGLAGHTYAYHRISDPVTEEIRKGAWDAAILDSTALGICTYRPRSLFFETIARWSFLAQDRIVKVVFPQDDANHGGVMDDWFAEWGVQAVFSVRPEHKALLYPKSSKAAEFHACLAGYIDDRSLEARRRYVKPFPTRTRLIGQRVTMYPPRGGRQGRLKGVVAEAVKAAAEARGIAVDISTRTEDVFNGDGWFRFLGDCRYVLGTEGGLSLNDPYGEIYDRIDAFIKENPNASFEEVEAACFPGLDGVHVFEGFSPRLLEAAVFEACQILVEGGYRGILEPDRHYIPLKADCSNIDEVFEAIKDEAQARRRIRECRATLVDVLDFRYSTLARRVLALIEEKRAPSKRRSGKAPTPSELRSGLARAVREREYGVGFRGAALAERVGAITAGQVIDPLVAGRGENRDLGRTLERSAAIASIAADAALKAERINPAGLAGAALAFLTRSLGHLARVAEAASNLAVENAKTGESAPEIAAAADALDAVWIDIEQLSAKLEAIEPASWGAAQLARLAGAPQELVEALSDLAAPEIDGDPERLTDVALRRAARSVRAIRQGGRPAEAISTLAHDPPDDLIKIFDYLAPAWTATGSWPVDDRARLDDALTLLNGFKPGAPFAQLARALLRDPPAEMVAFSRRMGPLDAQWTAAEIERVRQMNETLSAVEADARLAAFVARRSGDDLALLSLAEAASHPDAGAARACVALVTGLADSGEGGLKRAADILGQCGAGLDAWLAEAVRLMSAPVEARRALAAMVELWSAESVRGLAAALATRDDALLTRDLALFRGARREGAEGELLRAVAAGLDIDLTEVLARLALAPRSAELLEAVGLTLEVSATMRSTHLALMSALRAGGGVARLLQVLGEGVDDAAATAMAELARRSSPAQTAMLRRALDLAGAEEDWNGLRRALDLAYCEGETGRFLAALAESPDRAPLELLAAAAPTAATWSQAELSSFQVLAAVVGVLRGDDARSRGIRALASSPPPALVEIMGEILPPEIPREMNGGENERLELLCRLIAVATHSPVRGPVVKAIARMR